MDLGIRDRVALVAAASRGLGKAIAWELAREGAHVAICARGKEQLKLTAEEIAQDVFLRVRENAALYDQNRATFRNWLTRITRNRAIDALRRNRVRPEHHAIDWAEPSFQKLTTDNTPSRTVELQLQQERVRAAIAQLPEEQGQALRLAYLQGYTHHEIAKQLDEPLGTIKTRIRLGMQKLRNSLQE